MEGGHTVRVAQLKRSDGAQKSQRVGRESDHSGLGDTGSVVVDFLVARKGWQLGVVKEDDALEALGGSSMSLEIVGF